MNYGATFDISHKYGKGRLRTYRPHTFANSRNSIREIQSNISKKGLTNVVINLSAKLLSPNETKILVEMNYFIARRKAPTERIITEIEAAMKGIPNIKVKEVRQKVSRAIKKAKPPKRIHSMQGKRDRTYKFEN